MTETTDEPTAEVEEESKPRKSRKSMDNVLDEIARGEWGTGQDRRLRLAQAGIDHREVQRAIVERANPRR